MEKQFFGSLMLLSHSMPTWREFDQFFTICLYHRESKILKIFSFFYRKSFEIWPSEILTYFDMRMFFKLWAIFKNLYHSSGIKIMKMKLSVLNNPTKDLQKTDIYGNNSLDADAKLVVGNPKTSFFLIFIISGS